MDTKRAEELLASMAREQIKINRIHTFFEGAVDSASKADYLEVISQLNQARDSMYAFEQEYNELIGLLV